MPSTLLSRSPRSRKSLASTVLVPVPAPAKPKRPHSIAPGENPALDDAQRRSFVRPTRGILKPSNQADDPTQDFSIPYPTLDDSHSTTIAEFHADLHDNTPDRRSLGPRRVSFAARAHVRVFESAQDRNASSPVSSSSASAPSASPSPRSSPAVSQPHPGTPRRPSHSATRRASMHVSPPASDDGEESMDVTDDSISMPAPTLPEAASASPRSDTDDSEDDDGDMSMTGEFGPGIVARRRTLSLVEPRRSSVSRMRSSIAAPPSEGGEEAMEFTVALDRPPPPESAALRALRAVANAGVSTDADASADMDVTTALARLMHVRNSVGPADERDDSFDSTEDSFDADADPGDRTVNVTSLLGKSCGGDEGDSAAPSSVRATAPPPAPSPAKRAAASRPSGSPSKPPPKQFTAAFAPLHQPLKRSAPPQQLSPSKRRAIGASTPVPAPVASTSTSPNKAPPVSRARRPSGYFRKSLPAAGGPSHPASSTKQAAQIEHKTPAKPAPFVPRPPTPEQESPKCAREERRQADARASPTRGSPAPASPQASPVRPPPGVVDDAGLGPHAQGIDPGEWASAVHGEEEVLQEEDMEPISVDNFFVMTGIRFMDDLTCPRRSTVHPSQLQHRDSTEGQQQQDYLLSDYAVAMAVDIAQLETMIWIANDIRSAIEKYKAQYRQTEEDAAKDIPLLFREFATASEKEREQLLYVLKLIKAHTIGSAKASWYEWKRGWVQGLQTNAERTLDNLDADERQLGVIAARAGETLPALRIEYEQIVHELEEETAAVTETENCDQTFLAELKGTIAEQKQELDVYRNDIKDGQAKLMRLQEKLEDLEDQAREARTAISAAQHQMDMQKSSTRAEVYRLQDELRSLQDLHLWHATMLSSDRVEFVYDSQYAVVIPCRRFTPIPEALEVLPFDGGEHTKTDDEFPLVTEVMFRAARRHAVQDHDGKLSLKMIIQRLTDFWASYAQIRWQLNFIIIKYPLSLSLIPADASLDEAQGFKATATLLLFQKTCKAHISFHFDIKMLASWPMVPSLLHYDVAVAYGGANPRVLEEALRKRLSEVNSDENHACLVDACMEVVSQYS